MIKRSEKQRGAVKRTTKTRRAQCLAEVGAVGAKGRIPLEKVAEMSDWWLIA